MLALYRLYLRFALRQLSFSLHLTTFARVALSANSIHGDGHGSMCLDSHSGKYVVKDAQTLVKRLSNHYIYIYIIYINVALLQNMVNICKYL